jgi:hypothetical protein
LRGSAGARVDIHVKVSRVPFLKPGDERCGEPFASIRARVEAARERQITRCKVLLLKFV